MSGGPSRCFSSWVDFTQCMEKSEDVKSCQAAFDDYNECLHHGKEIKRRNRVAEELRKRGGASFLEKVKAGEVQQQPAAGAAKAHH